MGGRFGYRLLAALALGGAASPLLAQASPGQSAPTREEIERDQLRPTVRPPSRLVVEGEIERAPCALDAPQYSAIRFRLSEVQFGGLQGMSPAELRATHADLIGKDLPIAAVCDIRDRAATALRQRGYLAAVQVPPQEIENGIVRLDVLMAKVVSVQVRGDAGRSEGRLAGFLEALTRMPVFNEREAERYLLLARDLPGLEVRLTLRPAGTTLGEVVGEVTVEHTPFELDANVQNFGGRDVGRWGGLVRAQFNGLTGLGDRTSVGVFTTADFDEQQVVQLFHDFGLGSEGLRVAGRLAYAWTRPSGTPLEIRSRTLLGGVEASFPFLRSQVTNLYGAFGLDYVDQEIDLLGSTTNRDRLRIAYARVDLDTVDEGSLGGAPGFSGFNPRWRLGGSIEARQGLDIFSATDPCPACTVQPSRVPGTSRGTLLRASGIAELRPLPQLAFALAPRAQYSFDPLFTYEEFSAGNYTVGRGYDPGTLAGDSGVGVAAEVRFGTGIPRTPRSFAFQPYAFLDSAWVWNKQDGNTGSDNLVSAGGGVRVGFGDRFRIDASLAVPLKRAGLQTERGDPRLLISFTTRLLPWNR
jgi:hemolysin activation/secretion protein